MASLFYFPVLFLLFVAYYPGSALEIKRVLTLDDDYNVEWRADLRNQSITFRITAKTLGYVGFGLSATGGMKNADKIIGGVNNGKPYFSDYHGEGNWKPEVDASQDWELVSAFENSTNTTLQVSRVFNTCDKDDVEINNDTTKFIWSIGVTDEIKQHQKYGTASVIILNPETHPGNLSFSDAWEIMVNTKLPNDDTVYWCTAHKSPSYTTKRHIIGFKVKLESAESRNHTHHLILHYCMASSQQDIDLYEYILGTLGGLCYENPQIFWIKNKCEQIIYGWAVGADSLYLPENVGIPLNELGSTEYFLLEIHYDNPKRLSNLNYETGITAYTTTNIRRMKLRQFRNGTELPWLAYDNQYDFNFQQNRLLSEYRKIFKGDHLTYECTDESISRTPPQAVLGGLGTQSEMCLAFLMYYPRVRTFNYCESSLFNLNYLLKQLEIEKMEWDNDFDPLVKAPAKYANKRYSEVLRLIPWTDDLKAEIQNLTRFGKHAGTCKPSQHDDDGNNAIISYPEVIQYILEDACRRT